MKEVAKFLENISAKDDVLIVYNNDADGITACSLLIKMLDHVKKPYIIAQPMPTDKNLIQRIKMSLPTKIIFLDLAMDQQESVITKIRNICDILVIDHHRFVKNLTGKGILHYNPRFEKQGVYQSTAYLVYKICNNVKKMEDHLWIAAVGMVGDYNLKFSGDLVKEIMKKYNIDTENLYESMFGRMADMIAAANSTREISCDEVVNILVNCGKPEDFLGNHRLVETNEIIQKEMREIADDADKTSEIRGKFVFYNIKSKYNLRSPASTMLSEKYPGMTVVVFQRSGNKVKASFRNQGKVDITKMLKKAIYGMKAVAGGHENAAGALVNAADWEKFKERLLQQ